MHDVSQRNIIAAAALYTPSCSAMQLQPYRYKRSKFIAVTCQLEWTQEVDELPATDVSGTREILFL